MSIDWTVVTHLAAFKRLRSFNRLWNFEPFSGKICAIMSHSEHVPSIKPELWQEFFIFFFTEKRFAVFFFDLFLVTMLRLIQRQEVTGFHAFALSFPSSHVAFPFYFHFFFLNGFLRRYTLVLSSSELILIRHTGWGECVGWGGEGNLWG